MIPRPGTIFVHKKDYATPMMIVAASAETISYKKARSDMIDVTDTGKWQSSLQSKRIIIVFDPGDAS